MKIVNETAHNIAVWNRVEINWTNKKEKVHTQNYCHIAGTNLIFRTNLRTMLGIYNVWLAQNKLWQMHTSEYLDNLQ